MTSFQGKAFRALAATVAVVCIGIGVGVLWHWGAGVATGGLLLWIDMQVGK